MPAAGSNLGNDKRVSASVCVVRTSHTAGMLGLSVDVGLHSVLIFFLSLPKFRQHWVPTHIYSSLCPFLNKHRPTSTLKEGKSSEIPSSSHHHHPLWFYVVIMMTCEFWHCSLLWGQNHVDSSSLYLTLSSFSKWLCWVTMLKFNSLTAIFCPLCEFNKSLVHLILINLYLLTSSHDSH